MYIVKRPFRNLGRVLTVGSIITEPTEIKRFKGRLAEGKILHVRDKDYEHTRAYFKKKYGVDIGAGKATTTEPATDKVTKTVKTEKTVKATVKKTTV